jgi:hypothetical protein
VLIPSDSPASRRTGATRFLARRDGCSPRRTCWPWSPSTRTPPPGRKARSFAVRACIPPILLNGRELVTRDAGVPKFPRIVSRPWVTLSMISPGIDGVVHHVTSSDIGASTVSGSPAASTIFPANSPGKAVLVGAEFTTVSALSGFPGFPPLGRRRSAFTSRYWRAWRFGGGLGRCGGVSDPDGVAELVAVGRGHPRRSRPVVPGSASLIGVDVGGVGEVTQQMRGTG